MSKELPGFKKSAPTHLPQTKGQNPVSAWDIDLSPFHQLVDQQVSAMRHLTDNFLQQMEGLVANVQKPSNKEDKVYAVQEKVLHNQKKQARESSEIRKNLGDIAEQLIEMRQSMEDMAESYRFALGSIQKNTQEMLRPLVAQENLLREGFGPSQISEPLEKLVVVEKDALAHLQALQQIRPLQATIEKAYTLLLQRVESIDSRLQDLQELASPISSSLQSNFAEKDFFACFRAEIVAANKESFGAIIGYCEQIARATENSDKIIRHMEKLYEDHNEVTRKQQDLHDRKLRYRRNEAIMFWIFVVFVLVLFVYLFIKP